MTTNYHQRYCLECIHFDLDLGSPAYSEYTPGEAACMSYEKGHWCMGCRDDFRGLYREEICMARTCPDFEPDPELAKIGKEGSQHV